MPLTWFAHQVPVIGMKLGRPKWLDATALCLGSMMPDVLYSISGYVGLDTHRSPGAFVYGMPAVIALTLLVRYVLAPVGPRQLPDLGTFRLHSWAVIATRRTNAVVMSASAFLGIGSHIVIDWFTHPGRPGVTWLGYDDIGVTAFGVTEPLAGVFQLLGHTLGSLACLWLIWYIGRERLLEQWYSEEAVETARSAVSNRSQRLIFGAAIVVGIAVGVLWGMGGELIEVIQRIFVGAMFGSIAGAAGIKLRHRTPRSASDVIRLSRRR